VNDFYVGYEPEMPDDLAPRVRAAAVSLVVFAFATSLGLAAVQGRFGDGVFEFGHERVVTGLMIERPYPLLVDATGTRYFLVGPGKRGAIAIAKGFDGRVVRGRGTLIERGGERMLQVAAGAIQPVPGSVVVSTDSLEARGTATFEGEIVDSKCHLGVMKPGEGPLHRDCAVRCLLGGAPPMLVVNHGGNVGRLVMIAQDLGPLHTDLAPWTARPVRLRGVLFARGDERYLAVNWQESRVR
jgi:hypothetical protein